MTYYFLSLLLGYIFCKFFNSSVKYVFPLLGCKTAVLFAFSLCYLPFEILKFLGLPTIVYLGLGFILNGFFLRNGVFYLFYKCFKYGGIIIYFFNELDLILEFF